MSDGAEKAWQEYEKSQSVIFADEAFMAGWHARDAEVANLRSGRNIEQTMLRNGAELVESLREQIAAQDAVIARVRAYAEDRAFHARGHLNTVNSGRIASDLQAILSASPSAVLAEHDHAVLVDYEKRRKPDPIHIDNIDGLHAATWLAEHDARLLEELAAEAATSFGWLDPDDAGRASRWIASRAAKRREGAGQ